MRYQLASAAFVIGLAALPVGAASQEATDSSESSTTAEQLAEQDLQFAHDAAADGKAEVELGQMAVDNASNSEVQQFGQMMVDDHSMANDQLAQIAEQKGIELPTDIPPEAQEAQDRLSELSGAEFDREYVKQMVTDHEKAVELFQTEVDTGEDPELKQFAQETLPTLQQHLDEAQQLETRMSQIAEAGGEGTQPAADGTSTSAIEPAAGDATQQAAVPQSALGQMTADELIGKSVVNQSGESVGDISNIVISKEDQAVLAIISVGGFLGIGEKDVAVPFEQLEQGQDEAILLSSASQEELEQMPAYEEQPDMYEDYPRDQSLSNQ